MIKLKESYFYMIFLLSTSSCFSLFFWASLFSLFELLSSLSLSFSILSLWASLSLGVCRENLFELREKVYNTIKCSNESKQKAFSRKRFFFFNFVLCAFVPTHCLTIRIIASFASRSVSSSTSQFVQHKTCWTFIFFFSI